MKNKNTTIRDEWDGLYYPSISEWDNEIIRTARRKGFCAFFPVTDKSKDDDQGEATLKAAKEFLVTH